MYDREADGHVDDGGGGEDGIREVKHGRILRKKITHVGIREVEAGEGGPGAMDGVVVHEKATENDSVRKKRMVS